MSNTCIYCSKKCKEFNYLAIHLQTCKSNPTLSIGLHTTQLLTRKGTRSDGCTPNRIEWVESPAPPVLREPLETLPDIWDGIHDLAERRVPGYNPIINEEVNGAPSIIHSSSRSSNMDVCKQEFYTVFRGRPAGTGRVDTERSMQKQCREQPFNTRFGLEFAKWLGKARCTKSLVQQLLSDTRFAPLQTLLNDDFRSADGWLDALNSLPSGQWDISYSNPTSTGKDFWKDGAFEEIIMKSGGRILRRSIMDYIRFALNFKPFGPNMIFEPVRQYNVNGGRIYTDLHTGDWWWNLQERLPSEATIVPILLHSDKTQLSTGQGDRNAWPVYVTIGNLPGEIRRADGPGHALIAMLSIDAKLDAWHEAMDEVTKGAQTFSLTKAPLPMHELTHLLEIIPFSNNGTDVICSDNKIRQCYPVICLISADYEEQVLVTGIKKTQHCPICKVPAAERCDLFRNEPDTTVKRRRVSVPANEAERECDEGGTHPGHMWPKRTHEDTRKSIRNFEAGHFKQVSDEYVHTHDNFAWKHQHLNVHEAMGVDILHQIHTGVVKTMFRWIMEEIDYYGIDGVKNGASYQVVDQVRQAFQDVPAFFDLKVFANRTPNDLIQWTGADTKALIKQMVAILTPLLIDTNPWLLRFTKALVDFAIMASYRSHDDNVLRYMESALLVLDNLKSCFVTKSPDKFSFPKWHALTHYVEQIRLYGPPIGYSSAHGEAFHKTDVKQFFSLTNKGNTTLDQLMVHNRRRFIRIAHDEEAKYEKRVSSANGTQHATSKQGDRNPLPVRTTRHKTAKYVIESILACNPELAIDTQAIHGTWMPIETIAALFEIDKLERIVAAFVSEERERVSMGQGTIPNSSRDRINCAVEEAGSLIAQVHFGLHVPRARGLDSDDTFKQEYGTLRCCPNWRNSRKWRRDFIWIKEQEVADSDSHTQGLDTVPDVLRGTRVGQMQLILTVKDNVKDENGEMRDYKGVVAKVYEPLRTGRGTTKRGKSASISPGDYHGLIELVVKRESQASRPSRLDSNIMYSLDYIIRGAHIVNGYKYARRGRNLVGGGTEVKFVNPYASFEDFNEIYWADFETEPADIIRRFNQSWKEPLPNTRTERRLRTANTKAINQAQREADQTISRTRIGTSNSTADHGSQKRKPTATQAALPKRQKR